MGQLLVNEALPDDMRDHSRVLDKKGINALLRELAQRHPEKYVEVSHKLNTIGRDVATQFGGYTFGLEHLQKAKAGQGYVTQVQAALKSILANTKLTPEQRHAAIIKATGNVQQRQIDDIYDEAVKANNPLALQVVSGSRGNKMNLATLLGSDMLYADHRDEVIPLPVTHSYSQGLRPVEYWAATYGARKGTLATKFAVQNAGFLNKQLNQVAHRLMVVDEDDERDTTNRGLPVDTDDDDNEGALLAQDVGPYKRNTVLTPKIMRHLKGLGHDRLLVRSPVVGGSPDGGEGFASSVLYGADR
jgi:DNA-directed RNA polymerase subunit beta'